MYLVVSSPTVAPNDCARSDVHAKASSLQPCGSENHTLGTLLKGFALDAVCLGPCGSDSHTLETLLLSSVPKIVHLHAGGLVNRGARLARARAGRGAAHLHVCG